MTESKLEPGGYVRRGTAPATSGEYIISSRNFSLGISHYKTRRYRIFYSWKAAIEDLHITIEQARLIRTGHMVKGWQLRHIDGRCYYKPGLVSTYVKRVDNKRKHKVYMKSPKGIVTLFPSMKEAEARTGISIQTIRRLIWGYESREGWTAWDEES